MREQEKVLRLWRDVEAFQIPDLPPDMTRTTYHARPYYKGKTLPWVDANYQPDDRFTWTHTIYLGEIPRRQAYLRMAKKIAAHLSEADQLNADGISGIGFSASMIVGSDGKVVESGYAVASFVPALRLMMRIGDIGGLEDLITTCHDEFEKRMRVPVAECPYMQPARSVAQEASRADPGSLGVFDKIKMMPTTGVFEGHNDRLIGWQEIFREENALRHLAPGFYEDWNGRVMIVSRRFARGRGEVEMPLVNSFYLKDLDRLVNDARIGAGLGAPINAMTGPAASQRADVLQDKNALLKLLSPERLTRGRWPASPEHPLSLGQQAAVGAVTALADMSSGLVSVNGPPGTGKTTLLRDVIAEVITRRASKMAQFSSSAQLFADRVDVGRNYFTRLKPEIFAGTGIVVTSNNNAAVENISLELPDLNSIDRVTFPDAGYFPRTATQLLNGQPGWAAISGCLGNSGNRNRFLNAWFEDSTPQPDEERVDLKGLLESGGDDAPSWNMARERFLDLERQVEDTIRGMNSHLQAVLLASVARESLEKSTSQVARCELMLSQLNRNWEARRLSYEAAISEIETRQAELEKSLQERRLDLQVQRRMRDNHQTNRPGGMQGLLHKMGGTSAALRDWEQRLEQFERSIATAELDLEKMAGELEQVNSALSNLQARQKLDLDAVDKHRGEIESVLSETRLQKEQSIQNVKNIEGLIEQGKAAGYKIPDEALLSAPEGVRQLASVWTTPAFDKLRSELFLAALDLHRAFLVDQRKKIIQGLRLYTWLLRGSLKLHEHPHAARDLWDLLFAVLPVVSTSLASLPKMFECFGQGELPWLLIDEAGQATPGAVAGAIWRARRVVVVGDPQQIPPVVTVPEAVISHLMLSYGLTGEWSPADQSTQTLADRSMPIGAWIGEQDNGGVWGGLPLRAHRRCSEPMFSIANSIAYDGQMVQAGRAERPSAYPLGPSAWFNVPSLSHDGPVSRDEIKSMREVAKWTLGWNAERGKTGVQPVQVFMISPFRKVADELRMMIQKVDRKNTGQIQAGTVHTFQGREAPIVFMVLGSQPGDKGAGQRAWASAQPNLLNVAVTRAQDRLYMIGSVADWGRVPGFDLVASGMRQRGAIHPADVLLSGVDRSGAEASTDPEKVQAEVSLDDLISGEESTDRVTEENG